MSEPLTAAPMLSLSDVSFSYGNSKSVFSGASMYVGKGSFTCVVGESGAGKTTLLKLLYGQIIPQNGSVSLLGVPISSFNSDNIQSYRKICGLVFQDSYMIPELTIIENIALPYILHTGYTTKLRNSIYVLAEQLGVHSILEEMPLNISAGERQRAGIIRALAASPSIVLADEPTGSLDDDNKIKCFYLLHQLTLRGSTVVCATHDAQIVQWANKKTTLIKDGKCVEISSGHN